MDQKIVNRLCLLLVLLIPLSASVYYAVIMPVSCDEAWTFLNFTQKGLAVSAAHYPAPNNHVLHSLATNLTYHLPGFPNLIRLRLSSIVFNAVAQLLLFRFTARNFDLRSAWVVTALASVLFLNIYYGYMSRGYALQNLCLIGALSAAFEIAKTDKSLRHWLWFGLFCVLGFYAMPSFLYPFVTLNAYILFWRYRNFRLQFIANSCIVLVVLLLYLPILLNDGLAALTQNPYVKPVGLLTTAKSLPYLYFLIPAEITGWHWAIVTVLAITALVVLVKNKERQLIVFFAVFLCAPVVLLLIHRVIPFARVFAYYGFVLALLLVLPYRKKIRQIPVLYLLIGIIGLQLLLVFNFGRKIKAYEDKDLAANITAAQIIPKIIGDKSYFFSFVLLETNLEFELISHGYKHYQIRSVMTPASADTISADYIFINPSLDRTLNRKKWFSTRYYNVYQKNQDGH